MPSTIHDGAVQTPRLRWDLRTLGWKLIQFLVGVDDALTHLEAWPTALLPCLHQDPVVGHAGGQGQGGTSGTGVQSGQLSTNPSTIMMVRYSPPGSVTGPSISHGHGHGPGRRAESPPLPLPSPRSSHRDHYRDRHRDASDGPGQLSVSTGSYGFSDFGAKAARLPLSTVNSMMPSVPSIGIDVNTIPGHASASASGMDVLVDRAVQKVL